MKRFKISVMIPVFVSVFALGAIAATPASAVCKAVWLFSEGRWTNPTCLVAGPPNNFKKVTAAAGFISGNWECREVETGETATYSDTECLVTAGTKRYVWVHRFSGAAQMLSATEQTSWTGTNVGEPLFESSKGFKLKCTKSTAEGTLSAKKESGTFHLKYEGCTEPALKVKCTSPGQAEGIVLWSGAWKSVIDLQKPAGAAIIFEGEPIHFTCSIVLGEVKGSALCVLEEPTSKKTSHEYRCEGEKGKPKETEYMTNSEERITITKLLFSKNAEVFEEAANLTSGTITFKEAVEITD